MISCETNHSLACIENLPNFLLFIRSCRLKNRCFESERFKHGKCSHFSHPYNNCHIHNYQTVKMDRCETKLEQKRNETKKNNWTIRRRRRKMRLTRILANINQMENVSISIRLNTYIHKNTPIHNAIITVINIQLSSCFNAHS